MHIESDCAPSAKGPHATTRYMTMEYTENDDVGKQAVTTLSTFIAVTPIVSSHLALYKNVYYCDTHYC